METKIKIDLDKIIRTGEPVILELGCGNKEKSFLEDGRIGIDKLELPNVDIVADIERGLSFLPNDSVDAIHSKSLLEHIDNFMNLMEEIVRVLKKGGKCHLFVPHFSNPYYYSDPTHKRFFGLYTFYYFVDQEHQLSRGVPSFYTDVRIKIIKQRFRFRSQFRPLYQIKKWFEVLVNSHGILQEFYEENLCYIIPCYALNIVFTPDK